MKKPILQFILPVPFHKLGRPLAAAGLVVLAAVVAYSPALNGGFIWDDSIFITENPLLRSWNGLAQTWFRPGVAPQYYPVTHTVFWLEWNLWGMNPAGYHVVNLCLHLLNAGLLWALLRRWKVPGAGGAAALFALHPVHVESVAWISELKNVLSTFFFLAAAWCYWTYRERGKRADRWKPYAAALALFAAALGSKTVTCVWPVAMLIVVWWKDGRGWLAALRPLAPFFALGLIDGVLTAGLERDKVGAQGPEWEFSLWQRLGIAGRSLWFYLGKLAWPEPLVFIYPRWRLDPAHGVAALLLYVAGALKLLQRQKKWGRAPFAAVLFFTVALAPALGFVNFYPMRFSFVADHFQYLASMGIIALFGAGVARVLSRQRALAGFVLVAAVFTAFSARHAMSFRGPRDIWADTAGKNPDAWIAHNNLGFTILADEPETALSHFQRALKLRPDYVEASYNLGIALLRLDRLPEAEAQFKDLIRLQPGFSSAHVNLGNVLYRRDRLRAAEAAYREALRLRPDLPEAEVGLGNVLSRTGRIEEALAHFEQAAGLAPDSSEIRYNMGLCLMRLGRLDEADAQFRIAASTGFMPVHNALGDLRVRQGRFQEAAGHYRPYAEANPQQPDAWVNLGAALARAGDIPAARDAFETALRLDPKNKKARANLAQAQKRLKNSR